MKFDEWLLWLYFYFLFEAFETQKKKRRDTHTHSLPNESFLFACVPRVN